MSESNNTQAQQNTVILSLAGSTALHMIRAISMQFFCLGISLKYLGIYPADGKYPYVQYMVVSVFYVLSGFLIMYSCLSKRASRQDYGWWDYFANRFVRIYGALIPGLLFVVCIDYINLRLNPTAYPYPENYDLGSLIGNLLMLENFPAFRSIPLFGQRVFGTNRPLWALPVGWWICVLFGLLVYACPKYHKKPVFWLIVAFCAISPISNVVWGANNGLTFTWLVGALVCVCLFSKAAQEFKLSGLQSCVIIFFTLILAWKRICKVHSMFQQVNIVMDFDPLYSALLGAALFVLLLTAQNDKISLKRIAKPAKVLSGYSFILYLTHYSLIDLLCRTITVRSHPYLMALIIWVVCNVVAILLHLSFERWMVCLLKKGFVRLQEFKRWLEVKMYF